MEKFTILMMKTDFGFGFENRFLSAKDFMKCPRLAITWLRKNPRFSPLAQVLSE